MLIFYYVHSDCNSECIKPYRCEQKRTLRERNKSYLQEINAYPENFMSIGSIYCFYLSSLMYF
jgi:hypothetical protein